MSIYDGIELKKSLIASYSIFHFPCAKYIQIDFPYCSNGYSCTNVSHCILWQLFYPIDFPEKPNHYKTYHKKDILNPIQLTLF